MMMTKAFYDFSPMLKHQRFWHLTHWRFWNLSQFNLHMTKRKEMTTWKTYRIDKVRVKNTRFFSSIETSRGIIGSGWSVSTFNRYFFLKYVCFLLRLFSGIVNRWRWNIKTYLLFNESGSFWNKLFPWLLVLPS